MVATYPEAQTIELSPVQSDILDDDRRYITFIAGRGVGKGWSVCCRLMKMIDDGTLLSGALVLVMAPTYPQLKIGAIRTFDKLLGGAGMILGKVDGNEPERRLVRNITVIFRNASNPDQTRGGETQIVWLDEAGQMPNDVLTLTNMNNRQFREFQGGKKVIYQTFVTTTPRGKNWVYRDLVNPESRKWGEDKIGYYHMTTEEAVELGIAKSDYIEDSGYIEGTKAYEQEILGMFTSWTGQVFHYDSTRDTPSPFILPKFKKVVGGIDVGTTSPTAMVLVGIDEAGKYWVFKEYYQRRADMHDWMRIAGEWTREYDVNLWSIDAAANLEYGMMKNAGFRVANSLKAKDAAGTVVNFINGLMERNMFRLSPDCTAGIMEIQSYEHKEIQSGDEVTFLDKVKPNQPDHFIDAMRYAISPLSTARVQNPQQSPWSEIRFAR